MKAGLTLWNGGVFFIGARLPFLQQQGLQVVHGRLAVQEAGTVEISTTLVAVDEVYPEDMRHAAGVTVASASHSPLSSSYTSQTLAVSAVEVQQ